MTARESLPTDLTAAHAIIIAERAARIAAEAHAARVVAENSNRDALIAHLKLQIEKLRREFYGSRSERKARLPAFAAARRIPPFRCSVCRKRT